MGLVAMILPTLTGLGVAGRTGATTTQSKMVPGALSLRVHSFQTHLTTVAVLNCFLTLN